MTTHRSYTVRPSPKGPRTDLKDVFWIYLSPANLVLHGLRPRDVCQIQTSQGNCRTAIVLDNPKIQDSVVQTSQTLREIYGLTLGDSIAVLRSENLIPATNSVVIAEVVNDKEPIAEMDRIHWAWIVRHVLHRAEHISTGMKIEAEVIGQKRIFDVVLVNRSVKATVHRFDAGSDVAVTIESNDSQSATSPVEQSPMKISNDRVAGLDHQLSLINNILADFDNNEEVEFPEGYPASQHGIVIHGPSGTGKTLLLDRLADCGWKGIFPLAPTGKSQNESDSDVRQIFSKARRCQPSVIIIDDLDIVAGKSRDSATAFNVAQSLSAEMNCLGGTKILVAAATRSLRDMDDKLKGSRCFNLKVETTVPDARSRMKILKIISGLPENVDSHLLRNIGERTHGYVGADLFELFVNSMGKAKARARSTRSNGLAERSNGSSRVKIKATVTEEDLSAALLDVRPSAMREVILETPKVQWSDIGGQHEVKNSLKKAIEWPLKYPEVMKRTCQKPQRGLLLYGPPGCSKTLIAKALATEVDFNFIAVKGAELLSMYVGESERAIREVFRKARAASPSIIFFDEIDALGASRKADGGGLHVLTTLLNELDGIEEMKGVFVLGATNNPAILDPALIRPGRFSRLFYVGLPDTAARAEILQLQLREVDSHENIDVPRLASAMEGYSGAEIVEICQKAGEAAMEQWLEAEDVKPVIEMTHLLRATEATEKGVSKEQIQIYEQWRANRH